MEGDLRRRGRETRRLIDSDEGGGEGTRLGFPLPSPPQREEEGQLVQLPPLPHSLFPPPPPTLIPTLAVLQRFEQEGQSVELPRAHEGGICPGGGGRVLHEVVGWRLGWLGGIEVVGQQLGW